MRRKIFLLVIFGLSLLWVFYHHHRQAPARARALRGSARSSAAGGSEFGDGGGDGGDGAASVFSRPEASRSEAAVLLLAPDQPSAAAAAALGSAGIPFTITRDLTAALRRPFVLIPFSETPVELTPALRARFDAFARAGGTLVMQAPVGDPWALLTGLAHAAASRERRAIAFGAHSAAAPELTRIPLAARGSEAPWTRALETRRALGGEIVARYDTGEPAVLLRRLGAGKVYTLGVDLRDVVMRPHAGKSFDAGRVAQGLEPAADAWSLLLLRWYQEAWPAWVRLRAVPGSASVVLALSHGVETESDVVQGVAISSVEAALGARSTWFFRTGASDEPDEAQILDPRVIALARALAAAGQEIGSHAVLHAEDFEALPESPESAAVDAYRPGLTVDSHAQGADIKSEAAVSRARLERVVGRGAVLGLRTPGLSYPTGLADALDKAGYLYDSSLPQHDCLSARPFLLPLGRGFERETPIVELPVAFEDERDTLRPDGAAVAAALASGAAYEATVVWALRPSATGAAGALRRALSGKPRDAAVMRLGDVARFWRARAAARFYMEQAGQGWRLTLDLPEGAPALSFELSREISSCSSSSPSLTVTCEGKRVTVRAAGRISGEAWLWLR